MTFAAREVVRVEPFVPEPMIELLTDVVSEPRSQVPPAQRAAFWRKRQQGPERFRQALLEAWIAGVLDTFTAIRWLQRGDSLKFADLPKNHEEWDIWLDDYAKREMS